jgi:hypothetical protein
MRADKHKRRLIWCYPSTREAVHEVARAESVLKERALDDLVRDGYRVRLEKQHPRAPRQVIIEVPVGTVLSEMKCVLSPADTTVTFKYRKE